MIGIDWGTTAMRAFRLENQHILERREAPLGISSVGAGGFERALRDTVGDWLEAGESGVLMCGMVGSRQGWREAPYVGCPAGADALAAGLLPVAFPGATVAIVPGVQGRDAAGVPEVMRGEETQLVGLMDTGAGLVCLPGTHSKWAVLADCSITGFTTHLTGEAFAALRGHTILGRMMQDGPAEPEAFLRGVARAQEGGGLLHHLFGVRTLGLFAALSERDAGSYLSGLLIGHEVAAAAPSGPVHLVGAAPLCRLYALALEHHGIRSEIAPSDLAATGLALIAERAGWK